jgi:hypothetical protein
MTSALSCFSLKERLPKGVIDAQEPFAELNSGDLQPAASPVRSSKAAPDSIFSKNKSNLAE